MELVTKRSSAYAPLAAPRYASFTAKVKVLNLQKFTSIAYKPSQKKKKKEN